MIFFTLRSRMRAPRLALALRTAASVAVLGAVAAAPTEASAYPTSSFVSKACHETITEDALRHARLERPEARPLTSDDRDDRALVDDIPFELDNDMMDLGAVTLVLGVRDNDLKGRGPNEVDSLAQIHGNPAGQREHCLRAPTHDEPGGSQDALKECRAFIREMVSDALDGLDASGRPTLSSRVPLVVTLSVRGQIEAPVPRYYLRMGQALHAVQDGFTHTYRAGDRTKVSVVLNYVDVVNGDHVEGRDGPEHSSELDRCDGTDELRIRNRALATLASSEMLRTTLDPALSKDQKMSALDALLNRYFSYESGCTEANGWCNAPEKTLPAKSTCGCSFIGADSEGRWGALLLAAAAAVVGIRRLRRRASRAGFVGGAALLSVAIPSTAHAQSAAPVTSPPASSTEPVVRSTPGGAADPADRSTVPALITPTEAEAVKKERAHQSPFAIAVGGAGAFYNAGVSGMVGARFRLSETWVIGLDGELNGWYGIHTSRMRTGATSIYASLILRFPLRYEQINLRSALMAGTAIQMVDLYGAPKGSVGIFAGINPLGVEWKVAGSLYVIFYPLGVAIPATNLSGAPFAYPQFRTTLGLELAF